MPALSSMTIRKTAQYPWVEISGWIWVANMAELFTSQVCDFCNSLAFACGILYPLLSLSNPVLCEMPQVVSANRLSDGIVVFLGEGNAWVETLGNARLL